MPVGIGLHHARAFLRMARANKRSVALVFLDLTEAFYRIWRPLCLDCDYNEDLVTALAQRLHLQQGTLQQLRALLCGPPILERSGLPSFLVHALSAIHDDTWFQLRGQNDCVRTEAGTRPGDSLADIIFSYVFAEVLRAVQDRLAPEEVLTQLPTSRTPGPFGEDNCQVTSPYLGPVWMDDLCVCVEAPTCELLEQKVQISARIAPPL